MLAAFEGRYEEMIRRTRAVSQARRTLLVLASLFAIWAPLVVLTGGFGFRIGALSISSRRPRNAVLLALLLMGLAWTLAPRANRTMALRGDFAWLFRSLQSRMARGWRAWTRAESRLQERPRFAHTALLTVAVAIALIGFPRRRVRRGRVRRVGVHQRGGAVGDGHVAHRATADA